LPTGRSTWRFIVKGKSSRSCSVAEEGADSSGVLLAWQVEKPVLLQRVSSKLRGL
jgi:hypothetical protein